MQGLRIGSVCHVHGAWYACLAGSFLQAIMDKEDVLSMRAPM
jgi:hypothetical protein